MLTARCTVLAFFLLPSYIVRVIKQLQLFPLIFPCKQLTWELWKTFKMSFTPGCIWFNTCCVFNRQKVGSKSTQMERDFTAFPYHMLPRKRPPPPLKLLFGVAKQPVCNRVLATASGGGKTVRRNRFHGYKMPHHIHELMACTLHKGVWCGPMYETVSVIWRLPMFSFIP